MAFNVEYRPMKIRTIETRRVSIPFKTGGPQVGMRPSLNTRPWQKMESLIVRIETEDGMVGWGEAFGHLVNAGTDAILQSLVGPWFLGKDSRSIVALMQEAQHAFHGLGRNGPVLYALSAIDIALWDLAGKRAGQPVFRMLGGQAQTLELYASLMRYGGDLEAVRRNCARAVAAGFTKVKIHEQTIPAFLAAREAVGPETRLMLDVNCPWSVDEARAVARAIRDHDFHWLEEPVWPPEDFAGLATVRSEGVAIAAGENVGTLHEFQTLFQKGSVDFVQPSVIKIGGISAMMRVVALAQVHAVRVVPHCFYWGPGYLATAHVAAAMPNPTPVETAFIELERQPHPLFDPTKATLTLPESPGLGFEPDMAVLDAYTVAQQSL
jgi:L-alanine-DL-glutamate epimerase-like enolase superfamily enzyme